MPKGAVRKLLISMKIDDIAETIVSSFNEREKLKPQSPIPRKT